LPEWNTGSTLSQFVPLLNKTVQERKCNKGVQGLKEEKERGKDSEESWRV
jgi:hypothetical protein